MSAKDFVISMKVNILQTLDKILPKLERDSFTTALAVFNVDKNRYLDRIPCKHFIMYLA